MYKGDIRVAIEQERLTRRKHGGGCWYEDPLKQAIDYCLAAEGITLGDVGMIAASDALPARVRHTLHQHQLKLFPRHLCHAASAYLMLPDRPRAGVLVYDRYGSVLETARQHTRLRETFSFFILSKDGVEHLGGTAGPGFDETEGFPVGVVNSIGMLYELVTGALGFSPAESGKTMGLAAHGIARYVAQLEAFIRYGASVDNCFACRTDDPRLLGAIEEILAAGGGAFAVKADMAASVQAIINKTLLHCAQFFSGHAIEHLLISGGCGLNTVANTVLAEQCPLAVPVTIPPHCGDAGLALGALWLAASEREHKVPELTFRGGVVSPGLARPGRLYTAEERQVAAQRFYPDIARDASVRGAADLARELAKGAIIAVLNGRSEIGPRALGGRSLLADPRQVMNRERLNRRIKQREPFRPFAPMVLESDYSTYFSDPRCADEFMLKTAHATEAGLRDAPAAIHIDGTARVQVIRADGDPFLIALLTAFRELTGVGILLNTSFNRRGEPIVETPADAIAAFLGLGADALYLDGDFYRSVAAIDSRV